MLSNLLYKTPSHFCSDWILQRKLQKLSCSIFNEKAPTFTTPFQSTPQKQPTYTYRSASRPGTTRHFPRAPFAPGIICARLYDRKQRPGDDYYGGTVAPTCAFKERCRGRAASSRQKRTRMTQDTASWRDADKTRHLSDQLRSNGEGCDALGVSLMGSWWVLALNARIKWKRKIV